MCRSKIVPNAVGSSRERANQAASDRDESTPLLWPNGDEKFHSEAAIDGTVIVYAVVDDALAPRLAGAGTPPSRPSPP
jgi:hypothetical protein